MKAKRVTLLVHRGMSETISKVCYEHEIKCLEALFGKGNVTLTDVFPMVDAPGKKFQIMGDVPMTFDIEDVDEEEAYPDMFVAYGRHPTVDTSVVEHVYGEDDSGKLLEWSRKQYPDVVIPASKPAGLTPSKMKMGMTADAEVVREGEVIDEPEEDSGPDNLLIEMSKRDLGEMLERAGIDYGSACSKQEMVALYEQYEMSLMKQS